MKSSKILGVLAAVAVVLAVSSAHAGPVLSDSLTLFDKTGFTLAAVNATEVSEAAGDLYSFNHNYSNINELGHYILIMEPDGVTVSDVVGVANVGGSIPNLFGFMSGELTPAQIGLYFNHLDQILIETAPGIIVDSRLDPFLASYINFGKAGPGAYAIFTSDGDDPVPDGGMTVTLLGGALVGLEALRRKFKSA